MLSRLNRGVWKRAGRGPMLAGAFALGCSLLAGRANAQVVQTDAARTALPQPVGAAELNLGLVWGYQSSVTSTRDPLTGATLQTPIIYGQYYSPPAFPQFVDGDELTLAGLFKWRGEQINPLTNAKTSPGHFFPGCGFKAELVLHGGQCASALGWYNFTSAAAGPPAAADIQPLVPGDTTYLHTARTGFAPLGWDNRDPLNLSVLDWTSQAFSVDDIQSNPHYAHGDVAFALVGDVSRNCTANKFSVYEHNAKNASGVPWVTTLIYRSTVDPSAVYVAFEDLPMSAADWHLTGVPGSNASNDGDFNDFVYFISGLGATSACPDPACAAVSCSSGTTCSGGVCVPSGAGGAGGTGQGGGSVAAGGSTSFGGLTSAGGFTTSGGASGAATGGSAAGTAQTTIGGGAGGTPVATTGGASATANAGAAGSSAQVSNGGCSCRIAAPLERARCAWLCLALGATLFARRRLRGRALPAPALATLEAAHDKGIAHRDLP